MNKKTYFNTNVISTMSSNLINRTNCKVISFHYFLSEGFLLFRNTIAALLLGLILMICFASHTTAQQQYINNSYTNPATNPGAPMGSYAISNFEKVNLSNGNLNIALPLMTVGGRGSAGYTMMLPIEYKWTIRALDIPNNGSPTDPPQTYTRHNYPIDNWSGNNPDFIKYSPGAMRMQRSSDIHGYCQSMPATLVRGNVLSRMIFIGPDGTQYEFYDARTKGKPAHFDGCLTVPDAANRGNTWVSTSSGATFITDGTFTEANFPGDNDDNLGYPSGVMLLADGTRYRIDTGKVSYIVDRNGNKISFTYGGATGGTPDNLASVTDSLGRVITISYGTGDISADIISFKGSNGTARTIEVGRNLLGNLLRSDQTLKSTLDLFPGLYPDVNSNDFRNPRRVSYVKLPDGRQYNFKYSSYSDIARIELPTGGAVEYDWDGYVPVPTVIRWVKERRQYATGGSGANYQIKSKYEYFDNDPYLNGKPYGKTKVTQLASSANGDVSLAVSKHYFTRDYSDGGSGMFTFGDGTFDEEYQTENYNADGSLLMNKVFNEYEFREFYTYTFIDGYNNSQTATRRLDHRIVRSTLTLTDVSPNLVSKQEFGYDPTVSFNRQTDVYEYDFDSGQAGNFKRRTHTDYLTTNPAQNNADYLDSSISLKNLPTQTWVSSDAEGNNKVSKVEFKYDETSLEPRSNVIGWTNPNTPCRGNLTKTRNWVKYGSEPESWLETKIEYDVIGNVVKTIDAKGNLSTIDYTDNFGSPTGEARTNTAPTQLNGQSTFAFPTSATNALNWTTGYSQVDYFTGAPVDVEDLNGVVNSIFYNDALNRPTQIIAANNLPAFKKQTNILYKDDEHRIETKSDLNAFNDNLIKSESLYDGLGRTVESRRYESDGTYITTKSIPIVVMQDPETSIWRAATKISNPYRQNVTPVWTTSLSDSLGRGIKIITPDGATVKTAYSGNAVTVTDQAGKQRRSVTNALGQLKEVHEPNSAGQLGSITSPNQPTLYNYDVLNNLLQVQQNGDNTEECGIEITNCTQTRTFQYDSVSRLKQATNPESGTISYLYDNNDNLTKKTDARLVETNYIYDAINRVTYRSYSAPAGLPNYQTSLPVTYTYDNLPNSKGQLTKVVTGNPATPFSVTEYQTFDELGRVTQNQQKTDGTNPDPMTYTYNLSGALIEQKYPSGRVVKNVLDAGGDLSIVQSKKNANAGYWNYAKSFTYTAASAVSSMQLGNGKWESTVFNSRLQPTQIALGTVQNGTDKLKLNFDYAAATNNGNVQSQTITVPTVGQAAGYTATQNYTYDALNRLQSATETTPNQSGWKQTFKYDRYGNRQFDTTNTGDTTTLPANCQTAVCNPSVDPATNKLVGYTFDNAGNTKVDATGKQFTYDAENKQTEVKNSSSVSVGQYFYDGDGKRVKKFNPQTGEITIFIYDAGGKMIAEYSTTVEPVSTARVSYLTSDHLGSPRINTDANGNVMERHDYMPFGEEIGTATTSQRNINFNYGGDTVRQKFTAYERDNETNLDYAIARMFGSSLGRFTSPDPLAESANPVRPQSWNRYSYAYNNPLRFSDPTGMIVEWVQKDGEVFYDSRVVDQASATEIYGEGATYRPNGDQYTAFDQSKVELGDLGFFKQDGVIKTNGDRAEDALKNQSVDHSGSIMMGGLAISGGLVADDITGIGVADDPAIPVVIAGAAAAALVAKMAHEISRIQARPMGPQGVQYSLRATTAGAYTCFTCSTGTMNLNSGDVWKYGETINPASRYSDTELGRMGGLPVTQVNEFSGNQVEIKVQEKVKIYGYFLANGHLPPGNKIFR